MPAATANGFMVRLVGCLPRKGKGPACLRRPFRLYALVLHRFLQLVARSRGRRQLRRHITRASWRLRRTDLVDLGHDQRNGALEYFTTELLAQSVGERTKGNHVLLALDRGLEQRVYPALDGLLLILTALGLNVHQACALNGEHELLVDLVLQ